jgi:hypothetical protein
MNGILRGWAALAAVCVFVACSGKEAPGWDENVGRAASADTLTTAGTSSGGSTAGVSTGTSSTGGTGASTGTSSTGTSSTGGTGGSTGSSVGSSGTGGTSTDSVCNPPCGPGLTCTGGICLSLEEGNPTGPGGG